MCVPRQRQVWNHAGEGVTPDVCLGPVQAALLTCSASTHTRVVSAAIMMQAHTASLLSKPVRLRGNHQQGEEGTGELSNLAHCGLVHEPHFPLPPPQRGIVGGNSLLEALFGLVGNDRRMRIAS